MLPNHGFFLPVVLARVLNDSLNLKMFIILVKSERYNVESEDSKVSTFPSLSKYPGVVWPLGQRESGG